MDPARARDNSFGAARLAFAVLVVFNHSYKLAGNGLDVLTRAIRGQMDAGRIAVCFFFAISGFLVTKSWANRRSIRDYLRKRSLRIYPGYLAAVAICAAVVAPLAAAQPIAWWPFLRRLAQRVVFFEPPFYDSNFFAHNPEHGVLNGSLWSLKYEFICYLAVIVVGTIAVRVSRLVPPLVVLVALAIVAQARVSPSGDVPPVVAEHGTLAHLALAILGNPGTWPGLVAFFFTGMTVHFYADRIPRAPVLLWASLAAIALSAVFGMLAVALPVFGTYALFYGVFTRSPLNRVGSSVDLSYGIYLHSFWIQQSLVAAFPAVFLGAPLRFFACALALSAGAAFLSYRFVEGPAQRIKLGLTRRPAPVGGSWSET